MLNYALYILIGVVIVIYAVLSPVFLSAANIKGLLANSSALLVVATGMTFVLLIAEIDLSVGSIAGVSGAVWLVAMTEWGWPILPALLLAVAVAGVIGCANALLIVKLKINSFLVTLGMQILLRGFIFITVSGNQILVPKNVKEVLNTDIFGGFSPLVIISIGLVVLMAILYKYTSFGRKVQAVGCNKNAAAKVGISVHGVCFSVFVLSGLFAGLAGILQVSNLGMINAAYVGLNLEFLAITAVVLGGTSLFGGRGTFVPGTLIGVIFLMSIENGLGILGANPYIYPLVRGIVIYLAMFTDSLKRSIGNNE